MQELGCFTNIHNNFPCIPNTYPQFQFLQIQFAHSFVSTIVIKIYLYLFDR